MDAPSPYIPLSWLREKRKHVIQLYANNTPITVSDVWLWLVRQEISRLTIEDLNRQLYQAATYIGIEGYSCPLCTYENGVFIKNCEMHRQIKQLSQENVYLRKKLGMEIWPGETHTTLTREEWEKAYLGEYYNELNQ